MKKVLSLLAISAISFSNVEANPWGALRRFGPSAGRMLSQRVSLSSGESSIDAASEVYFGIQKRYIVHKGWRRFSVPSISDKLVNTSKRAMNVSDEEIDSDMLYRKFHKLTAEIRRQNEKLTASIAADMLGVISNLIDYLSFFDTSVVTETPTIIHKLENLCGDIERIKPGYKSSTDVNSMPELAKIGAKLTEIMEKDIGDIRWPF